MSDHIELPTDEELQHWEDISARHIEGQPTPTLPSDQGLAVAELARAVPRLLYLIRMERQDEAHRINTDSFMGMEDGDE